LSDADQDYEPTGELTLARRGLAALELLHSLPDGAEVDLEQRQVLAGWTGWGPLAKALDYHSPEPWGGRAPDGLYNRIGKMLDWRAMATAKNACDTAFYTPPKVTAAVWDLAAGLGFAGGRAVEPGCGSGRVMAAAPPGLDVAWTGIEADKASAAVASLLHPAATIIEGRLEKTPVRYGSMDLAVGNVPFSSQGPYDPNQPKGITSLHGYFLWRALSAVRPGGLAVFVVSRWVLDAVKTTEREELAKLGVFLGAVRLPETALAPGGTRVVADIVVFRRRVTAAEAGVDESWLLPASRPAGLDTTVSEYFQRNPGMVCGTLANRGGKRYGMTLGCVLGDGQDLTAELAARTGRLVSAARAAGLGYQARSGPDLDIPDGVDPAAEGHYTLAGDGTVTVQRNGTIHPVQPQPELVALITLTAAVKALFDAETDEDLGNNARERIRQHAMRLYQEYIAQFGYVSRSDLAEQPDPDNPGETILVREYNPVRRMFRRDPDWPTLLAAEVWDDDTREGRPAPILTRRVAAPPRRKQHTDDPQEALLLCLDEAGQVDLDVIARILQCDPGDVPGMLPGRLWLDPQTQCWVTDEEYLSGDVRAKLAAAKAAGEGWEGHVAALEQAIPADLDPGEINVQLGAPWLPPEVVEQFTAHLLGFDWDKPQSSDRRVTVRYEPYTSTWEVRATTAARKMPAATATWGTTRINAVNLIEDACNNVTPVVNDYDENKKPVRNREETALAADRLRDIQERFATWAWEDPGRADRLARLYNDRYNCVKVRTYDGSFLTFPGLSHPPGWRPYPHQLDMILRNICVPTTLCGHVVGAGKTFTAVASTVKLRQLGLIRKAAMVVPNHLLEQTCAEARRYFPGMQILMVTPEDLTPDNRKYFAAKTAARDWDLVVMTVQQFGTLSVSAEVQAGYYTTLLDELDAAQADPVAEESRSVAKMLARKRKHLIARLDKLADRRLDGGVSWEQTGIDWIVVDEAHWAKNLSYTARAEGFNGTGSQRADDLLMKMAYLRGKHPDGRVGMLMTGTPVSNSLAELWTLFKFCAPHLLATQDIAGFDAFAAQYIRYATQTEVSPDGSGFRQHRRPRMFVNLPELRSLMWLFADIRGRESLVIDGPRVVVEQVVADPPQELLDFTATLVARADAIRSGQVKPHEDNMLKVCGEGRSAALWLSLVGIDTDTPAKIEKCAANVAQIYHDTCRNVYGDLSGESLFDPRPGGFQLVFCDKGTPDSWDYGVYHRLRDLMVAGGVPARKIAFIHDAKTPGDKSALFARCRAGEIAVLIASTEKAGTGVNIQRRLLAIHHLDAPWRPADIQQRDGRGDRPGNLNDVLRVFRYATKGSFDAYMWQGLERKARFIAQILTGDPHVREVQVEDNPQVLTFGELKALATGQPLLMMLSETQAAIARLRIQQAGHKRSQTRMELDQYQGERRVAELADDAAMLRNLARISAAGLPVLQPDAGRPADGDDAPVLLGAMLAEARQSRRKDIRFKWRDVWVTVLLGYRKQGAPVLDAFIAVHSWDKPGGFRRPGDQFGLSGHVWAVPDGPVNILAQIDTRLATAETRAADADGLAGQIRQQAADRAPFMGQKWAGQADLDAALKRRDELEKEIDAQVSDSRKQPQPA
jgi:N12 class adenine-specific DNA methylase